MNNNNEKKQLNAGEEEEKKYETIRRERQEKNRELKHILFDLRVRSGRHAHTYKLKQSTGRQQTRKLFPNLMVHPHRIFDYNVSNTMNIDKFLPL